MKWGRGICKVGNATHDMRTKFKMASGANNKSGLCQAMEMRLFSKT